MSPRQCGLGRGLSLLQCPLLPPAAAAAAAVFVAVAVVVVVAAAAAVAGGMWPEGWGRGLQRLQQLLGAVFVATRAAAAGTGTGEGRGGEGRGGEGTGRREWIHTSKVKCVCSMIFGIVLQE